MDALGGGRGQVDLNVGAGGQQAVEFALAEADRQVDALHADPVEGGGQGGGLAEGDIGQDGIHGQGSTQWGSTAWGQSLKGLCRRVQAAGPVASSLSVSRQASRRARRAASSMSMPMSTSS